MKNFITNLFKKEAKPVQVVQQPVQPVGSIISIMYSYRIKLGFENHPLPVGENCGCEAFCKKLLELNRLYTRVDIQNMSGMFGYDVYKHCGGDGCIHEWTTERVRQKNN
ncbi:MAG: hypothetical protein V4520_05310 [Bacteroidota bacterium]